MAREIWPGGGSGEGEACRCLGDSGRGMACRCLGDSGEGRACCRLGTLSGRAAAGKENPC
ncbi:MAG: hypothetical protein IKW15_08405 [Bacteroidales bacterium]|nr:hypothetical protein [Bacteroidales bacterium]